MGRGLEWTGAEVATLKRMVAERRTHAEVAAALGRSERAVHLKASSLGVRKPPSRLTWRWRARAGGVTYGSVRDVMSALPDDQRNALIELASKRGTTLAGAIAERLT